MNAGTITHLLILIYASLISLSKLLDDYKASSLLWMHYAKSL